MNKDEKIKYLKFRISQCNDSYYYGSDPLVTDFEYDEMVKEFRKLIGDEDFPIFKLSLIKKEE